MGGGCCELVECGWVGGVEELKGKRQGRGEGGTGEGGRELARRRVRTTM